MILRRALLVMWLCGVFTVASAAKTFVTDKPSPLRLANAKEAQHPVLRFKGSVKVSGTFIAIRAANSKTTDHLNIVFYPDKASSSLLPRLVRDDHIKELRITNSKKAAAELIDSATSRKLLSGELPSATIEATATINQYIIATACDQRFYEATLLSVSKMKKAIAAGPQHSRTGCG
jgi:hypothetical protein